MPIQGAWMRKRKAPQRVLVTGGAGFIGSHVVRALLARYPNANVWVMHLPKDNLINLNGLAIETCLGDVTNPDDVARAVSGCDTVFHLAAVYALWLPDMSVMQRVNIEGTRNVMEACLNAGVKRVIHTSSFACFAGQGLDTACTERSPFALDYSYYSRTKFESQQLVEGYARQRGLDVVIVNPTCPIGPGDYGPTPTGRLLVDAFDTPVMVGLRTEYNYVDVRDCALGHLLAYEKGRTGESYILGGENFTHSDMMRRVLRITGLKRPLVTVPPDVLKPLAWTWVRLAERGLLAKTPFTTPVELDISNAGLIADASKARRELGLPTRPVEESIRDALAWFGQHGYLQDQAAIDRVAQLAH
jgi:dihydroflavonol-4-reductase